MNDINSHMEETGRSIADQHAHEQGLDTVVDDPTIQMIKEEENYIASSDDEKSDSQGDSLDGSHTPADSTESDARIEPNAFEDELRGKTLSEQVKFLKEQGLTFRTISERLNVDVRLFDFLLAILIHELYCHEKFLSNECSEILNPCLDPLFIHWGTIPKF
ncbi:unnamed protein product [Toxocara canis]|uniref:UBA_6 domain-containing protein n=1 Tax=Toxocara canis TaxID=6265 RepID=A0A183V6P8_TOXCA|nr:unnamed protein product [Toxocara canis]